MEGVCQNGKVNVLTLLRTVRGDRHVSYLCAGKPRSTWFILAFAVSCLLGSAYGFLQGAWPFGVVEAIWAVVAVRRWYQARH